MSRATLAQLKTLGLDGFALSQIDDAKLQDQLDSASARVDAALATQFDMPIIAPYPMDLIQCECVLASYEALIANGYNPAKGSDDNVAIRYKQWNDYLTQVSKGELVPQVTSAVAPGPTGPEVITATTRGYSERGIAPNSFPTVQTDAFSDD